MLVVRRIYVEYHLKVNPEKHEEAERAFSIHENYCPVARTIRDCVEITTTLKMENQ